jgi:hypothetical protein
MTGPVPPGASLPVRDYGAYLRSAHRVDQAINRDIVVARKVANPSQSRSG